MGDVHDNIYYSPPTANDAYHINGLKKNFSNYQSLSGVDETGSAQATSAPVNGATFAVVSSGAAHNAAGSLTSVKGSGGTTVELYNSEHFIVGDSVKTSAGVFFPNFIGGGVLTRFELTELETVIPDDPPGRFFSGTPV